MHNAYCVHWRDDATDIPSKFHFPPTLHGVTWAVAIIILPFISSMDYGNGG